MARSGIAVKYKALLDAPFYPRISNATYGTTLKARKKILNNPRNAYMTTLKVSRGMGNHLLCVRYTKSGANINIVVQRTSRAPFMAVHHIKNVVSV